MTSRTLRHGAALLGFLFALTFAWATPVKFDIPSQPVAPAIKAFIKQSKAQVAYRSEELEGLKANKVKGEFEPDAALTALLKDTGCAITRRDSGIFVVTKIVAPVTTGSVRGVLTGEGGKGMPNVLISIRETSESAETNRFGEYVFPKIAAGTYVLVASAPGYQPLHITDVRVRAGRELTLGKEELRKAKDGPLALEPFVVTADAVLELDPYSVEGQKVKPFTAANVDIPRTINDAQPYYIFDAKTIDQSGATNLDEFLKQRLTMNTTALTNGQISGQNSLGNISSINLRGLGADKTLILVNGRRITGVSIIGTTYQPDLNGIPLSAIDHIAVLPTSASGIYGGSAIGGVINIVLKKDYAGGEIRATYDNTWNTDSPTRTISASYGLSLEGGKTHVMLNGSWSDSQPLLLQDRRGMFEQNLTTIRTNSPTTLYTTTLPFLGALPNITASSSSQTTLTLKNGVVLPSRNTFVPAGTSAATPSATLYTGLAANSGLWNFDLPASTLSPTGLLRPFGVTPETKSFQASVRRQMLPKLEIFTDFSYNENSTESVSNPGTSSFTVPVASPVNPFTTAVRVRVPDATQLPITTQSVTRSFTAGVIAQLPWDWMGEIDFSWSESRFQYLFYSFSSRTADLTSGVLNPFVDTLLYPLNLQKYQAPVSYAGSSNLSNLAIRGSGPLWSLPWGTPSLTLGLEHRIAKTPDNIYEEIYPLSPADDYRSTFFSRQQVTNSAYVESTIPLVKKTWLPLVHALDLQVSGRGERYTVDTGTPTAVYFPITGVTSYGTPTLNGQPYFSKTSYTSTNGTMGLIYKPVSEVTVRASLATAFLPPTPDQLVKNPLKSTSTTSINDPVTGQTGVPVYTLSGGNPDLKPQSSTSVNVGIIWEPRWSALKGLRLNAEYYRIEQDDYIGSLSAQRIVTLESLYPGRVSRDSSGMITLVDISSVNLYKRETEGWDLSVDYTLKTVAGNFNLHAVESIILHLKNQYSLTLPEYESVNFPNETGAAKYKGNATLTWAWHSWTAGWTARHFSAYKQYGAAGGPYSVQFANGGVFDAASTIIPQGSDTIPSQTYHDLFVGYVFGKQRSNSGSKLHAVGASLLSGLTVQLGVRNVFDKVPPFDVYYSSNYYLSPYGDTRLRSYWISIRKAF